MRASVTSWPMPDVSLLFDEWAARFARGEEPDLREYLARAGEGADELAGLVEAFVAVAPAAEPSEERVALTRAWAAGQSPLLELRTRRGVRREAVVEAILSRFGLAAEKRQKVAGYYHELESGLLDPLRVDRRVWELLAELLRASVTDLRRPLRLTPPPTGLAVAYRRAAPKAAFEALAAPAAAAPAAEPEPPDEVDRLFRSGS
jgi:hypothetical protein